MSGCECKPDRAQPSSRRRRSMRNLRSLLLAIAAGLVVVTGAQAADHLLTGVISLPTGQKLDGVTVSANLEGSTITTSVYTDETGRYYFPPMPAGQYRVWAQALGFETARSSVDLTATRHHDFVLHEMTDPEERIRQLPSEALAAALPEATPDDARIKPEDRAFYENFNELSFNTPLPWSQGPRRMGTDKNADVLWVGNSWGASLTRINTKTSEMTIIPMPDPTMQAYHIAVDSRHNLWGNLWTSDRLFKFDPSANKWTMFELPVHGTEIRHISLLERDGRLQVIVPVYRSSQMGVMMLRTEADVATLKRDVQ